MTIGPSARALNEKMFHEATASQLSIPQSTPLHVGQKTREKPRHRTKRIYNRRTWVVQLKQIQHRLHFNISQVMHDSPGQRQYTHTCGERSIYVEQQSQAADDQKAIDGVQHRSLHSSSQLSMDVSGSALTGIRTWWAKAQDMRQLIFRFSGRCQETFWVDGRATARGSVRPRGQGKIP